MQLNVYIFSSFTDSNSTNDF